MTKLRNICATLNNWTEDQHASIIKNFLDDKYTYLVIGKEVGESGTPHLQIYLELPNSRAFRTLHKELFKAHIEARKGTAKQASDYCKKGEQPHEEWEEHGAKGPNWGKNVDYTELGVLSQQGKRTDLDDLVESIATGKRTTDEVCIEDPMMYHKYGRTLTKAEDILLRKRYRKEMTAGEWYYGGTGVGKSHTAYENYNPDTHYVKPMGEKDVGWWDGYTGQETVIINEFRGQLPYSELLDLMDKWPKFVSRRGREPVPFLAKRLIITSALPPGEVYHNLAERDSLGQLYRRCKVFHIPELGESPVEQKCSEGNTVTSEPKNEW